MASYNGTYVFIFVNLCYNPCLLFSLHNAAEMPLGHALSPSSAAPVVPLTLNAAVPKEEVQWNPRLFPIIQKKNPDLKYQLPKASKETVCICSGFVCASDSERELPLGKGDVMYLYFDHWHGGAEQHTEDTH